MKRTRKRAIGHRSAPIQLTGQPITTCEWIDRLAPKAWAVIAAGTCATYGGIHAMEGNPTGCMGLPIIWVGNGDRKADIPIVCVPGCPVQPDNFMETLLYLLHMAAGRAPMIPLDDALRPTWLFGSTVHEGCDRGGYYEQAQFAEEYGSPLCIVKLGCWGPVVQCNVGKRGWMAGIGGCPNVGGICIGCTMPGFPDKFMPFMNQPPGSLLSSAAVQTYGRAIHALRRFTQASLNKEPTWRQRPRGPGKQNDSAAPIDITQGRSENGFVCANCRKPKSSKSQFADANAGLPDIAEAEAVLLDLARVYADSALNPVLDQFTDHFTRNGPNRLRMRQCPTSRTNTVLYWSRYRRLSSWLISTGVSARRM